MTRLGRQAVVLLRDGDQCVSEREGQLWERQKDGTEPHVVPAQDRPSEARERDRWPDCHQLSRKVRLLK